MKNENVEFNEIRCKKLILGDEEAGFINLKVSNIDNSPVIEMTPVDGNEESSITIGFKNGTPILNLITNKTIEKQHIIKLHFDEDGLPIMEMGIQDHEENYDNIVALGLVNEGTPLLLLGSDSDQDPYVVAGLLINENGHANLILKNNSVKGGDITLRVDDDGGGIVMRTSEDTTNRDESKTSNKGITLINTTKMTFMDIKGQTIGGINIQEEKSSSKGESNE